MLFQKRGISELVAELTELMNEHGLSEIEYEKNGTRIKVSNAKPSATPVITGMTGAIAAPASGNAATATASTTAPGADYADAALKSPMVGVVYTKPEQNAKDFVTEGSPVKEGDVLCLIEAMKTFNQIKADRSGTIQKIFIKNGETVEFGQPLFTIG